MVKKLYVPWRSKYTKTVTGPVIRTDEHDCVFCNQYKEHNDQQYFILGRYKHAFVLLNLYPYNAGHIMILPNRHIASLDQLEPEERHEMIDLTSKSVEILQQALKCEATNVGINLGRTAGSGLPGHLHLHIVPRWSGDTNFLPVLFDVKTISYDLKDIYQTLLPHFKNLTI